MAWKKSSPQLIAVLDSALASFPSQRKTMFGYPVYLANGNMFAGLHQDDFFIRLSEPDQEALRAAAGEAKWLEPMQGRPMREYVIVPPSVYEDGRALDDWLARSFQFALSLPPKQKKAKK